MGVEALHGKTSWAPAYSGKEGMGRERLGRWETGDGMPAVVMFRSLEWNESLKV